MISGCGGQIAHDCYLRTAQAAQERGGPHGVLHACKHTQAMTVRGSTGLCRRNNKVKFKFQNKIMSSDALGLGRLHSRFVGNTRTT